jgi:hypothetical protein
MNNRKYYITYCIVDQIIWGVGADEIESYLDAVGYVNDWNFKHPNTKIDYDSLATLPASFFLYVNVQARGGCVNWKIKKNIGILECH